MKVVVSRRAAEDAEGIRKHLAAESGSASKRFVKTIESLWQWIGEHPRLTPVGYRKRGKSDVRLRVIPGFEKYVVFYAIRGEVVRVLRLMHGTQDWQRMLGDVAETDGGGE